MYAHSIFKNSLSTLSEHPFTKSPILTLKFGNVLQEFLKLRLIEVSFNLIPCRVALHIAQLRL